MPDHTKTAAREYPILGQAWERSQAVRMSGADAIVESLLVHGVDTVFGIPGVQTYALYDSFSRAGRKIKVIGPRHEQNTAYMAFGYAKSTGRPGVYSVVPGPGVMNTAAALCTAYGASAPIVCITGQVPSTFVGLGKGHLHEMPDQLGTLQTLTKWAARIEHPAEAPALVAEAFRHATSGRPRPVALEMPWDVFDLKAPVEVLLPSENYTIQPDPDRVAKAAALIKGAKNPMIMVGSGAVGAPHEVLALAEMLQAPVVSFRGGRGIVSDEHHLGFTCAAGFKRWHATDVLIGIGCRLELQWFRWPDQPTNLKIVNIDIDPAQVTRINPTISIVGDARESVTELINALERESVHSPSRKKEFEQVKQATLAEIQKVQPHIAHLNAIREVLPRDGFFVEEICQAGFTSYFGFPVYEPRKFVTCGHQGTLGFGLPTALGVKVGNPDNAVVSITGDGGFQFALQELATAVQYGINIVIVLFNNCAYGNVRRDQDRMFEGRLLGSELRNPDFVALAESFGVSARRVTASKELRSSLEKAFGESTPALIEVVIDRQSEHSPWEFLMPAGRQQQQT
jgi:acetolactate synthase-1/2/3 large subunit